MVRRSPLLEHYNTGTDYYDSFYTLPTVRAFVLAERTYQTPSIRPVGIVMTKTFYCRKWIEVFWNIHDRSFAQCRQNQLGGQSSLLIICIKTGFLVIT